MNEEKTTLPPKTDGKTIIEVKNLSKHFKGLKAVDKVNFKIKSGELIGIIGPNGAGKTTLFNLLSGFLKPEKGSKV
jgi:branched-chain amino acid transport system permease protein